MTEKLIKSAKKCPTCGHVEGLTRCEYSCDGCGWLLGEGEPRLKAHEHHVRKGFRSIDLGVEGRHFCNWECLLKWLPTVTFGEEEDDIKCVGLPHVRDGALAELIEARR